MVIQVQPLAKHERTRNPASYFLDSARCPLDSLSVGFLQEGRPELVGLFDILTEDKTIVDCGQIIVDDHVDPLTELPETKMKYSCVKKSQPLFFSRKKREEEWPTGIVPFVIGLIERTDTFEDRGILRDHTHSRDEPAIT